MLLKSLKENLHKGGKDIRDVDINIEKYYIRNKKDPGNGPF